MEKGEKSVAEGRNGGPKTCARVLARRSTSEWGVGLGGKTKCSVGKKDVKKVTFIQEIKGEAGEEDEEVALGEGLMAGAGEEERGEEAPPVGKDVMLAAQGVVRVAVVIEAEEMVALEPDEEVTVTQMDIPNIQINQATYL